MELSNNFDDLFESERSLGEIGDRLFLETRHRILTAVYRPGQKVQTDKLANELGVDIDIARKIVQALADHGYLFEQQADSGRIIKWDDEKFNDLLSANHDFLNIALFKTSDRMDNATIIEIDNALNIDLTGTITPEIFESFHIRWCMYFRILLSSVKVPGFRKMMLIGAPPALRRRIFISMDAPGLRAMHSTLRGFTKAVIDKDFGHMADIVNDQWQRLLPAVSAENSRFNEIADNGEIDYADKSLPTQPVFRRIDDPRPRFGIGHREPISWDDYLKMDII